MLNLLKSSERRFFFFFFFFNKKHTELQSNTPFWGGPEASSLDEI